MDWVIIILGVPAVLIPLVLLFGFAGCAIAPVALACDVDSDCPDGTQCVDGICVELGPPNVPPPPLAAPANLAAIAIDDRSVLLTWTSNEPGATFQIERAEDGGDPQPITPSGTISPGGTTDDSLGLREGVTFVYRVLAQGDGVPDSDPSDLSSATVLPATPGSLGAAAAGFGIALSWTNVSRVATEFSLERRVPGGTFAEIAPGPGASTTFSDTGSDIGGLSGATTYEYQVFAKVDGFEDSQPQVVKSLPSLTAPATTLAFPAAFTAPPGTLNTDQSSIQGEGICLLQRFSPTLLAPNVTGTQVRLTLRGANSGSLTLDRVFISRPDPTLGADRYDSGPDLTDLSPGAVITIAAGGTATVGPVNYNFDSNQDLLVAFDISNTAGQGNLRFGALNGTDTFARTATAEAGVQDRGPNYITAVNNLFLIEKIEVL